MSNPENQCLILFDVVYNKKKYGTQTFKVNIFFTANLLCGKNNKTDNFYRIMHSSIYSNNRIDKSHLYLEMDLWYQAQLYMLPIQVSHLLLQFNLVL